MTMTAQDQMPCLNGNNYLVEERADVLKAAFNMDIRDPDTGEVLMECREDNIGPVSKCFRFSELKRTTPFDLHVRTPAGAPVMRVRRGIPIAISRVKVLDETGFPIGEFKQKPFSFGGAFDVLDATDVPVCRLEGKRGGTLFRFLTPDQIELARVTKKWAGLGKELFTSADHHLLTIDDAVPPDKTLRRLILASAICIGMVLKIELP